ncbi:hypothetical protein AURDEDRAFT_161781 [Auricularia subglabra TFB-10046 SS5]|nr:hypothetical protein AURDEDRAFT_161781 [Auricularia subglabra TFB-10046 SS5]
MPPAQVSTIVGSPAHLRALAVMNSPDLVRHIVCFLPNAGQVHSSRYVSRAWYGACHLHLRSRLDINHHIGEWFCDVLGFRRLQCELELVISGSFAVKYFKEADDKYKPIVDETSDMDLFVEWTSVRELAWFLDSEGFSLDACFENNHNVSLSRPHDLSIPDDSFERVLRYGRGPKHIDVVCTSATPVYCIFRFHCTPVMNFITWNKAYCMYPFDSLIRSRGLILRENNDRTRLALDKYRRRGFKLVPWWEGDWDWLSAAFRARHRWVGDAHCWTVALDTTGITTQRVPWSNEQVDAAVPSPYIYELNGFDMRIVRAQGATIDNAPIWAVEVNCQVLEDESLLFSYAADSTFSRQVQRYIQRVEHLSGRFWSHRRLDPTRDARLLRVKAEHKRLVASPGAVPHSLFG